MGLFGATAELLSPPGQVKVEKITFLIKRKLLILCSLITNYQSEEIEQNIMAFDLGFM